MFYFFLQKVEKNLYICLTEIRDEGEKMNEKAKKLKSLIDWFFECSSITEVEIKFSEPVTVDRAELYSEIVGNYDSSTFADNGNNFTDIFIYNEKYITEDEQEIKILAKLLVDYRYRKETGQAEISKIQLWREKQ